MLGTRGKLIRYRPDRSRAPAGGVLAYEVHMLLLITVRIVWHLSFTVAAPLAIWYEQARATGLLDRGADMGTFVMFSTITICTACVIQPLFVQPLYAVCSVLFSRSLMGSLAQPGKAYGWHTREHSRWTSALALNARTATSLTMPIARLWTGTSFPRTLFRLAGATVGRHSEVPARGGLYPMQPETSLITIGECFSTDGAASAYAHNFGKGYMEFPPLTIGAGVHLSHLALVNPGLHVPDGTHVGPASSVSKLTQLDDSQCLNVQGNPPRRCQRTQSQHYVHEGSNVREWEDAARTIAKRTSPWGGSKAVWPI